MRTALFLAALLCASSAIGCSEAATTGDGSVDGSAALDLHAPAPDLHVSVDDLATRDMGGVPDDLADAAAGPDLACPGRADVCPKCKNDEVCSGGNVVYFYAATCLKKCTTTSDCPNGMKCAKLAFGLDVACVSDTVPGLCPGTIVDPWWHCDFFPPLPRCTGPDVLATPFSEPKNMTCGSTLTLCPNGCEQVSADAGPFSLGRCK